MGEGIGTGRLILREMQRSKVNTLLCAATIIVATAMLIAMIGVSRASVDATRIQMKNMGFNLLIVPKDMDLARYQALDFQEADMPEDYVHKLADQAGILAQHFVGKYQRTIQIDGRTAVLTGVVAEKLRKGTDRGPMPTAYTVPEGEVYLGVGVSRALGKKAGDTLDVLERTFKVGAVLDEAGVVPDDIRIYAHLADVQALLDRPGRINAIDALACMCPSDSTDLFRAMEESIRTVLPDTAIQPYKSILLARQEQRTMLYRLELAAVAVAIMAGAAAIWGLTSQNVRSRRYEIGVLRALGVPNRRIAWLFVGRILLYSVAGALLGCVAGHFAAVWLNVSQSPADVPWTVFVAVVLFTPLAATLFGLPPVAARLLQEPVEILGEGA